MEKSTLPPTLLVAWKEKSWATESYETVAKPVTISLGVGLCGNPKFATVNCSSRRAVASASVNYPRLVWTLA